MLKTGLIGILLCVSLLSMACSPQPATEPVALPALIQLINLSQEQSALLDPVHPESIWRFRLDTSQKIKFNFQPEKVSALLSLSAEDGQIIAESETAFEQEMEAPGWYTLTVSLQEGAGWYTLTVESIAEIIRQTATPIPQTVGIPTPSPIGFDLGIFKSSLKPDSLTGGIFSQGDPDHLYTYEGQAGEIISVSMKAMNGSVDPFLSLYDSEKHPIAMDDNSAGGANALLRNIVLPAKGVYVLIASAQGFTGNYNIEVLAGPQNWESEGLAFEAPALPTAISATATPVRASPDTRLQDRVTFVSSLTRENAFDRFSFYAVSGEKISIGINRWNDSNLIPRLEVYDPLGVLVASSTTPTQAIGQALIPDLIIPETGTYLIFVMSDGNSKGEYLISYSSGDTHRDEYKGDALVNEQNKTQLSLLGGRDTWRVVLQAGDYVTVAVNPTGAQTLDPLLLIMSDQGEIVASDDNSGGGTAALINSFQIEKSGVYFFTVQDAGNQAIGDYTLVWRYINIAPTATEIPDYITWASYTDTIEENQYQFYVFQAKAGQRFRIRLNAIAGSPLDPVLAVIDPAGKTIAEADDSNGTLNPELEIIIPRDGSYSLRVNGYLTSGAFQLFLEWLF